ncbi:unnamed protein product [Caretta caretta]
MINLYAYGRIRQTELWGKDRRKIVSLSLTLISTLLCVERRGKAAFLATTLTLVLSSPQSLSPADELVSVALATIGTSTRAIINQLMAYILLLSQSSLQTDGYLVAKFQPPLQFPVSHSDFGKYVSPAHSSHHHFSLMPWVVTSPAELGPIAWFLGTWLMVWFPDFSYTAAKTKDWLLWSPSVVGSKYKGMDPCHPTSTCPVLREALLECISLVPE